MLTAYGGLLYFENSAYFGRHQTMKVFSLGYIFWKRREREVAFA